MFGTEGSARLRKVGMIGAAMAVTAVAAATPMTATAAIVYTNGGESSASGPVTVSVGPTAVFDLLLNTNKGSTAAIGNFENDFAYIGSSIVDHGLFDVTILGAADTVSGSDTFITDSDACFYKDGNGYCGNLTPGQSGYFGFKFSPDGGTTTDFGWAQVAVANDGNSLTLLGAAYDDTGAAIAAGAGTPVVSAAPEPSTWVMMFGGLALLGAALRRRRLSGRWAAANI